MTRKLALIALASLAAQADSMERKANLGPNGETMVVRRLDAPTADSDTLEILDGNGKAVWSSLDHPDLPQIGKTGEWGAVDLEGDGRDELALYGGRGPGDIHYAFLQWDGKELKLHSVGAGFYVNSAPGQKAFRAQSSSDPRERFALLESFERRGAHLQAKVWASPWVWQAVLVRPTVGGFEVDHYSRNWTWAYGNVPLAAAFARPLDEQDLEGKSPRQLALIRNSLYAVYGRPFKDAELAAYFGKQQWYQKDPKFSESKIPSLLKENARFIQAYQEKHHKNWL